MKMKIGDVTYRAPLAILVETEILNYSLLVKISSISLLLLMGGKFLRSSKKPKKSQTHPQTRKPRELFTLTARILILSSPQRSRKIMRVFNE